MIGRLGAVEGNLFVDASSSLFLTNVLVPSASIVVIINMYLSDDKETVGGGEVNTLVCSFGSSLRFVPDIAHLDVFDHI